MGTKDTGGVSGIPGVDPNDDELPIFDLNATVLDHPTVGEEEDTQETPMAEIRRYSGEVYQTGADVHGSYGLIDGQKITCVGDSPDVRVDVPVKVRDLGTEPPFEVGDVLIFDLDFVDHVWTATNAERDLDEETEIALPVVDDDIIKAATAATEASMADEETAVEGRSQREVEDFEYALANQLPGELEGVDAIAQTVGLYPYGKSMVTNKVRDGIRLFLASLFLVPCVDFALFSIFTWMALTAGFMDVWWGFRMIASVITGMIFAGIQAVVERSVLAADLSDKWYRVLGILAVRTSILGLYALIGALVIGVLLHAEEIDDRHWEELVIEEAVTLAKGHARAQREREALADGSDTTASYETSDIEAAALQIDVQRGLLESAQAERQSASDDVNLKHEAVEAQKRGNALILERGQRKAWKAGKELLAKKQTELDTSRARLDQAKVNVKDAEAALQVASDEHARALAGATARRDLLDVSVQENQEWIARLVRGDFDNPPIHPGTLEPFEPHRAGASRRLTIMLELVAQLPPRWPPADEDTVVIVTELFPGVALPDGEMSQRDKDRSFWMRVVFGLVFVFPMLLGFASLGVKLGAGGEIKAYYNQGKQRDFDRWRREREAAAAAT